MIRSFTIDDVFPWGRSFDEYRRMFNLSDADLDQRILGCADGPAAFNAAMARAGRQVISCDPLYQFPDAQIRERIDVTHDLLVDLARRNAHRFVWDSIRSPEEMGRLRMQAMLEFLGDYELGRREGRYRPGSLPSLDFADGSFDLALCSHFLFLYSEQFTESFHVESVREMTRIAPEARIFPLLDMQGRRSPHVDPVMEQLRRDGLHISIERVPYKFQRGGDAMMRIRRPAGR